MFNLFKKKSSEKDKQIKPEQTKPESATSKFSKGLVSVKDIIAPSAIEVDFDWLRINNRYYRTLYVINYPRFVSANWLSSLINFDQSLDISMNIYPTDGKNVLSDLRRKIAEMEAEISSDIQRGKVINASTKAKLEDALVLQEQLVKGIEKFFQFGLYISVGAKDVAQLNQVCKELESSLGSLLIIPKHATLQMEEGFKTTLPIAQDLLKVKRNMDTTSLASTFPFVSSDLSDDKGIMYGLNEHNGSLVVFDRFSMENYNSIVFATSGAGKSIAGNEPVLVRENGQTKLVKAKKIVNRLIAKHGAIQIEDEIQGVISPPNLEVFTFNQNLQGEWSEVTVAARKIAPKKLYKITTQSGREITITKDHNLITLKNGRIETLKGDQVQKGDIVPLPKKINNPNKKTKKINLLKLLNDFGQAYIYGSEKIIKKLQSKIKNKNHPKYKYLYKYIQGRPIPVNFFNWICKQTNYAPDLNKIKIGSRLRKFEKLPINLPINQNLAFLLGLVVAEGCVEEKFIVITNNNQNLLKQVKKIADDLRLDYFYSTRSEIRLSNTLFAEILIRLGVGQGAKNKKIPNAIFGSPNKTLAAFLQAYFEGDGGVENHRISATSKSKQLISQLSYLLKYFGIGNRIKSTRKYATNTKKQTKRTYWQINIYGQKNLKRFKKHIDFFSNRKQTSLQKIIGAKANTNTDSIPLESAFFKKLTNLLYSGSSVATPKLLTNLALGNFKPSPQTLKKVIFLCKRRIAQLNQWGKKTQPLLNKLPEIENLIEKITNNKKLNNLAWQKLSSSWATIKKNKFAPQTKNTLILNNIANQTYLTPTGIYKEIRSSFEVLGLYQKDFDKNLFSVLNRNSNANIGYQKIFKAKNHIFKNWQRIKQHIYQAEQILQKFQIFANSNLFWDPIKKIEKIKNKDKYVYDFTVDNEVFLAGFSGMFVHNSYMVKLEALRSLMFGTEIIVIDPENEFKNLCNAVGGQYITFDFESESKINPFDLELSDTADQRNELSRKILSLHSMFKIIMGDLEPEEDALLDRALVRTYKMRGITPDPETQTGKEMPLIEDLYKTLIGMEHPKASSLAARIEKFIKGSFAGLFNSQTTVNINNKFVVFGLRDLEEALRPVAMHVILEFIWNKIRKKLKRRILIIDEAWTLMQHEDSAQFLYGLAKRARKYYLGITNITQDVDDFLDSKYGSAVVKNSAIRILMKQHPAAIEQIVKAFYLSEGERQLLLSANIGQGIFFAGRNHAAIRVVASPEEHKLITSNPEEVLAQQKRKAAKLAAEQKTKESQTGETGENVIKYEYGGAKQPKKAITPDVG